MAEENEQNEAEEMRLLSEQIEQVIQQANDLMDRIVQDIEMRFQQNEAEQLLPVNVPEIVNQLNPVHLPELIGQENPVNLLEVANQPNPIILPEVVDQGNPVQLNRRQHRHAATDNLFLRPTIRKRVPFCLKTPKPKTFKKL